MPFSTMLLVSVLNEAQARSVREAFWIYHVNKTVSESNRRKENYLLS